MARRPAKPERARAPKVTDADNKRLLHELEVHQFELETQNEELRNARSELELALARYTELFDFAPLGYATLDASLAIRKVNHAGARLIGYDRARIIGVRFGSLIAEPDRPRLDAAIAQAAEGDAAGTCEVRMRDTERSVRVTITPEPKNDRELLIAFEDITDRRAEQQRLADIERALRDANRRKDDFIAMLSHELRNPLAPIRTSLFVLDKAPPGSDASTLATEIIERQVSHLSRLVDDLLDATRISRGKIQLQRERVELGAIVRKTVDDHRAGLRASHIDIGVSVPRGETWVDVDAARIIQAISNLLGNSHKFTPASGRVDVTLRRHGDSAELVVRDTGIGIAPAVARTLFEPFVQAPQGPDRKLGGLGLGLATVRGLVELHGGTVEIASPGLGYGTTVTITLPLAEAGQAIIARARPNLASRRVLVIEDQRDAARALEIALGALGLDVRTAADGRTGLGVARSFLPEVVLCDLGLPDMDGHAVARAFRADEQLREIYLVALSGYAQPADIERSRAAGFSCHVAKPASLDRLVEVIASAP